MCGIAGCLSKDLISRELINKTLLSMSNRGPDNQSSLNLQFNNKKLYFFHSRLSIIDLKTRSNQPFKFQNFTLIFNGEIYNFREIKAQLISLGYKFKTESDTEVVIKAFSKWKTDSFNKFVGMWSIAIWDDKLKKLYLSRDRFGEKPFYYIMKNDEFYFASELRTLKILYKKKLDFNKSKINNFIFKGYKSLYKDDETFIEDVKQVKPSECLVLFKGKLTSEKYWKVSYSPNYKISYEDILNNVKYLVEKSVQRTLISDVPLSIMLSGGIDSSTILGIARKKFNKDFKSFSIIDNDARYDEIENINLTKKFLNNKNIKLKLNGKSKLNFAKLKKLSKYHFKPVLTISSFLSSLLTKKISNTNIKVNLSGIGADEIFTGYYDHTLFYLNVIKKEKFFNKNYLYWKKNYKKNIRNPYLNNEKFILQNKNFRKHIFETNLDINDFSKTKIVSNFEEKYFTKDVLRNRMLNECFYETIPVLTDQDDLNHMYNSIENRCPFLDKDLVEFVSTIPTKYLMGSGLTKNLLRESCKEYVDKKVMFDSKKKGFNASIQSIFDFTDKNLNNYILNKKSEVYEFVDFFKFKKLLNKKKYLNSESKFIFSVISTMLFIENFNEKNL